MVRSGRTDQLRAVWWPMAATVALLALSAWLTGTTIGYLILAAGATVAAVAGVWQAPPRARWWSLASTAALVLAVAVAAVSQWRLHRIDGDWPDIRTSLASDATEALAERVSASIELLGEAAQAVLAVPRDTSGAFSALATLATRYPQVGMVVYDGGHPLAWTGKIQVPVDSLTGEFQVVRSSFYTALVATESRGTRRAVVARLLDARSPADRLTNPLAAEVAGRLGIPRFVFADAPDSAPDNSWMALQAHGKVLTYARAASLTQDAIRLESQQRARAIVVVLLALALAGFVLGGWRVGRQVRWRLATVGVALLCSAEVPLNAFSNYSRLFDGGLYYTPIGGALTANAGALLVTGALVLFALLAAVRRLARNRPRAWWGLVVLVIAGLGPFLLRDLARGISIPVYGVNTSLWLIWEIPIFLAGCTVLLAGAAAGSAALGPTRGVAPWVGPALAALAALLAPVTWQAPGRWPWWYPIPWIVAIGALALARRSRAIVSSAAAVAALGAITLVWGATTLGRMQLAESDVRGLNRTDATVTRLVERFAAGVRGTPAPTADASREWLLRQYARSALAAAALPVWLSVWTTDSAPTAVVQPSAMTVPMGQVRALAHLAFAADSTVEYPMVAEPAVQVGVAIPVANVVVVAVAASPTRLIAADPFAKLLGIAQPPEAEAPYTMRLADASAVAPSAPARMGWERNGSVMRGDWITRSGNTASRVLVEVDMRSTGLLVQRGVLIALVDLSIVGLLWLLSVLADGAAGRWLRERQRRWRRSYRTQVTLALFGFFMIPAIAFAAWSYRQLASDAAQSRELLVRETLRSVAPVQESDSWLEAESQRLDAPLFLFRNGELAMASDPLLAALAPGGRFVPPDIQLALGVQGEVSQSEEATFGDAQALLGFRAVTGTGGSVVLAAPARADESSLERRRRDLGILVLFATVAGAFAAFWLSGLVARGLAGPIRSLRRAALTLAAGGRAPVLEDNPTVEFRPVFNAFRRMATDLEAGRAATAHAQRVLAWGEMARQVAHEIKNPLTPIRLGVQHLQRARADERVDFDAVLDENVQRILAEIDHLDEIARAFSRYGAAPSSRPPVVPTDVAAVMRDLVALERMGQEGIDWALEGADAACVALAQRDELREVLLNVFENARQAGARRVVTSLQQGDSVRIEVRDDGRGIPEDLLRRVFEPHFSTRTSGSGLGLAISRQLIEGWGGTIGLQSREGEGSVVLITLRPAPPMSES